MFNKLLKTLENRGAIRNKRPKTVILPQNTQLSILLSDIEDFNK